MVSLCPTKRKCVDSLSEASPYSCSLSLCALSVCAASPTLVVRAPPSDSIASATDTDLDDPSTSLTSTSSSRSSRTSRSSTSSSSDEEPVETGIKAKVRDTANDVWNNKYGALQGKYIILICCILVALFSLMAATACILRRRHKQKLADDMKEVERLEVEAAQARKVQADEEAYANEQQQMQDEQDAWEKQQYQQQSQQPQYYSLQRQSRQRLDYGIV